MSKKDKVDDNMEEEDEELFDDEEEDEGNEIGDDTEVIDSSLEIGGQIHVQSDVVKKFKQLPKDLKYSKFDMMDIKNFVLKSNAYQLWNYVNKIKSLSTKELHILKNKKKEIYDIKSLEDLKLHLDNINKSHLWFSLQQLSDEELKSNFKLMQAQLKSVKDSGAIEILYNDKTMFTESYKKYIENLGNEKNFVDDFGLMNNMMTLTEAKRRVKGGL